jgi:azurin
LLGVALVDGNEVLPFPENRLRDWYAEQARAFLESTQPLPEVLPAFPGLDGGKFGHWGQNTEANYYDHTLNEVDTGGVVGQVINHFGKTTTKAINVRVGEAGEFGVMFDPERLTFTEAWYGGFLRWESRRFGLNNGVSPKGEKLFDLSGSRWVLPEVMTTKYRGYYRSGEQVVFRYEIGSADIYDRFWEQDGKLVRSMTVDGVLPDGVFLESELPASEDNGETKAMALKGEARWIDQIVVTKGKLGKSNGPYVIDTLTLPYRDQNPFNTPFRVGGFDFLPDGRAAVCTIMGDVWLVDGIDEDLERLEWKRIAAGLHQALGLVVQDGKILVLGRDQITRLHDLNGDDEADFYECVTNDYPTSRGNSYALTLHQDENDALYWFTRSEGFGVTKYANPEMPESVATGLRGTNGTGVSPSGDIVFATVQEGTWTPASAIFDVGSGSYHGFGGPEEGRGKYGFDLPLCFIPRGIDNSSGDITFLPDDPRFGPLSGMIVGTSLGACTHHVILREELGGRSQGGVVALAGDFLSGAHRARYNPHDGQLYVAGSSGWESYAQEDGSLERVRYTGGELNLPVAVETRENGLIVRFNTELDPAFVSVENVFCEQWNYLYSSAYGSAEYSVKHPGRQGHDQVEVRSIHILEDGQSVFVEIPQLHPVMQLHLFLNLETNEGTAFSPDLYYSIFELGEAFTDFDGYRPIEKAPFPDFPKPENYPRDSRLVVQEKLGKSTGTFETLFIDAVPGMQYEPKRLQVKAGRRTALILKNVDVEMPHNLVITQPDQLDTVVEASMKLAADPIAINIHYVPEMEGIIAMSPLVYPGEQYAIYFDSPDEPGEYPFVCTFPGHWMIMRGILEVVE